MPKPQRLFYTGERLFPLVYNVHAHLAGKITGMLLEIDNSELLLMLESPESLNAKVGWSLGAVGRPEGGGGLRSQVSAAGTEEVGFLANYLLEVGVGESLVKGLRLQPLPFSAAPQAGLCNRKLCSDPA